ncbi:site-specific DNA-methyltransferase [Holzapfeliella floricola]|nr:site-specific DNA-methyltransferase [Holzapfeliella floricola]
MTFIERPYMNEHQRALSYIDKLLDHAKQDKENRSEDIRELEEIQNLLAVKKYGLVWEPHIEKFEEKLKDNIPVFYEDKTKKICDVTDSNQFNFLLEGDNLNSLHLLTKTHSDKIDVIYIDPPYNTGNKDFVYNDIYLDNSDNFKHSKWLSFMQKRLSIAKKLLTEDGVIFISIDDHEQSQLKLLMDEIFGEQNFIGNFVWNKTATAPALSKTIRKKFEFVCAYSNNRNKLNLYGGQTEGKDSPLLNSSNKISDLMIPKNSIEIRLPDGIYQAKKYHGIELLNPMKVVNQKPTSDIKMRGKFKWSQTMLDSEISQGTYLIIKTNKMSVRFQRSKTSAKIPSDLLSKSENDVGTNEEGKKDFQKLFKKTNFEYTKPVSLIKYLLKMTTNSKKGATILDFFAGSGTTGQAVVELNKEDGGNRNFILATNNENKISERITYRRMKLVSAGTKEYSSSPMNLKYFKTNFVNKQQENLESSLLNNLKTLVELKHGVDLDQSDVAIVTTMSEIEELELSKLSVIYMRSQTHIMLDRLQLKKLSNIKIIDIPEVFFAMEMKEAGL